MPHGLITAELNDLFFAGVGAMAAALSAVFYEMSVNLEWQERIVDEIRSSGLQTGGGDVDSLQSSGISKLPTLQACIKEALRKWPPFAFPFERIIAPGMEDSVSGVPVRLPNGTRIWGSNLVMSRSREAFGEDADEFRPERWLEASTEDLRRMNDMYCVLGTGSRDVLVRGCCDDIGEDGGGGMLLFSLLTLYLWRKRSIADSVWLVGFEGLEVGI